MVSSLMIPSSHNASIAFWAFCAKKCATKSLNSFNSASEFILFKAFINSNCAISLYDIIFFKRWFQCKNTQFIPISTLYYTKKCILCFSLGA